jgi:hypothetical protein
MMTSTRSREDMSADFTPCQTIEGCRRKRNAVITGMPSLVAAGALGSSAGPAFAHANERAFVLLLPTNYYLIGGTLAVAATFALLAFAPERLAVGIKEFRLALFRIPAASPVPSSIASLLFLAILVGFGFFGTQDPLENPLPLTVWTLWWVGFTLIVALFGNLWLALNPWTGIYRLLRPSRKPFIRYPDWLGHWPAAALFLGFAWFELVDPAPDNPERLAWAVIGYWLATLAAVLAFGEDAWLGKAEPFSLFFRLVALLSPFLTERDGKSCQIALALPGTALLKAEPLPASGIFFVLLVLAAVSFDGLSKTFFWLGLGGINPLEYPGRTALMVRNTIGLLAAWALLAAAYISAVRLGWMIGARSFDPRRLAGALALSIMPIGLAYHFAHYLTALLVNGQYAVAALLGLDLHVTTSFLTTYDGARLIWNLQAAAIVAGHLLAIMLAHIIAIDRCGARVRAAETPIAIAMIFYTLFGLWLLSAPAV